MWSINPLVYLRHAWDGTASAWGKTALILFYVLVWLSIITAIVQIIAPYSTGMDCVFEAIPEGYSRDVALCYYRLVSLFVAAFFFYADKGGLHIGNVGIVLVVLILNSVLVSPYAKTAGNAHPECMQGAVWTLWIGPVWSLVVLVLVIVDERIKTSSSTSEERQSLNV